jgi:hypothetical protein
VNIYNGAVGIVAIMQMVGTASTNLVAMVFTEPIIVAIVLMANFAGSALHAAKTFVSSAPNRHHHVLHVIMTWCGAVMPKVITEMGGIARTKPGAMENTEEVSLKMDFTTDSVGFVTRARKICVSIAVERR